MKISYETLQELMNNIDHRIDSLLLKIAQQQEEINRLESRNRQLEQYYQQTASEIASYIAELNKIRNDYVDSNHNNK